MGLPGGPKALPGQSFSVFNRLLRERLGTELVAYKIAHVQAFFLFVTIKPRQQSGLSLFLFADSEG